MILLLVVLGVREYERGGAFSLDTIQLLDGVAATDACLHHGELRCRRGVNYWPPLQYLPALALKRVGASRVDTGNDLVYLNGIAILAVLLVAWAVGRRLGGEWAALLPLAVLVSPLLWYAAASFGEALAAAATTTFVAALALGRAPALVAIALWAATISKETALPFLLALAALALLAGHGFRKPPRRQLIAVAAGALAGLATIAALNLFRYGVPWNRYYLGGDWTTHGVGWRADFFAAGLVAPNAGLVWFWPVAAALLGAAVVEAARVLWRARSVASAAGVVAGVALVLFALLASFASWWAPFGWHALGDRLIVPWVPALLIVVVVASREPLTATIRRMLGSPPRLVVIGAVTIALGLAELGAFLAPDRPLRWFWTPPVCPPITRIGERISAGEPAAHEQESQCNSRLAWRHRSVLADAYDELGGAHLPIALLYAAAVSGLLVSAATTGRSARPSPRP